MSMSTHIIGIRPPDDHWRRMKEVWDACKMAEVTPPVAVSEFFNHETPDDKGVTVDLKYSDDPSVSEWYDTAANGYEVDITKLPSDVTIIRFYNAW